jgi:hypothetical protein
MTKYTAFRCPIDLVVKAKIKAEQERRSLSNFIITLLEASVSDVELPKAPKSAAKAKAAKAPKSLKAATKTAKPGRPRKA